MPEQNVTQAAHSLSGTLRDGAKTGLSLHSKRAQRAARGGMSGQFADLGRSFVRSRLALIGAAMLAVVLVLALCAPLLAPHDPTRQNLVKTLMPPMWAAGGSPEFPLGTDHFGRDILSRVLYGANASFQAAGFAAVFALLLGVAVGLFAGFYRGWIDVVLMRIVDVFLAFPLILMALSLAAILGPSLRNLVIVMGITGWMVYARVTRAAVISLRDREFVQAAFAVGATKLHIVVRHLLPNIVAPALVLLTFGFAQFIIMESALSFLGLGIPPPTPTWGRMLNDARDYLVAAPWQMISPGLAIMFTVLSVNFIGDGLRDALDPRLRRMA